MSEGFRIHCFGCHLEVTVQLPSDSLWKSFIAAFDVFQHEHDRSCASEIEWENLMPEGHVGISGILAEEFTRRARESETIERGPPEPEIRFSVLGYTCDENLMQKLFEEQKQSEGDE